MPNRTIYLPKDLDDEVKKYNMNLSGILQEKIREILDRRICPTCEQKLPEK